MSHFFAYIDRMRYIERWALMRNSVRENIQEHSHQVAVLAHALAVIRNELFGGQVDAGQVAAAALYHDAGEILTGDMPTPIKYFNPEIREAYRKVEEVADQKLLGMLPPELRTVYEDILCPADPEVEELVKAADKLSAHIKCLEELKAGNEEFRQAARQTAAECRKTAKQLRALAESPDSADLLADCGSEGCSGLVLIPFKCNFEDSDLTTEEYNLDGLLDYPVLADAGCLALNADTDAAGLKAAKSAALWL